MSKTNPGPLLLPLLSLPLLSPTRATAQQAMPPDRAALIQQCAVAKTPHECHAALPACETVFKTLAAEPAGPQRDLIRDQLLNDWAQCEYELGQYAQAEGHYRSAHALRIRMHGREHPEVADSLNNLAVVLERQGKYAEAEPLHRQALEMSRKLLGAEHLDVASSLNNLAAMLDRQGKHAEAEPILRRALEMRRKLLGAEHPLVASSLNNLAAVSLSRAAPDQAVPLLRKAAAIREAQLRATVSETRMQALIDQLRGGEDMIYGLLLGARPPGCG